MQLCICIACSASGVQLIVCLIVKKSDNFLCVTQTAMRFISLITL